MTGTIEVSAPPYETDFIQIYPDNGSPAPKAADVTIEFKPVNPPDTTLLFIVAATKPPNGGETPVGRFDKPLAVHVGKGKAIWARLKYAAGIDLTNGVTVT
jgi:hypothetical protein